VDRWVPNLSWIQPDLAVGGSFPCEQAACLARDHRVGAVIDLRSEACDEPETLHACGVTFLHLPTPDMTGATQPMLDEAVRFARAAFRDARRLLIHCEHGIGRSAMAALCVLVDRGLAPLDALRLAKDQRALISPSRSQYDAWVAWLGRHALGPAPTYHEFGVVAYRHLAKSA
jgi:rhodanese-related sulfurtransferase